MVYYPNPYIASGPMKGGVPGCYDLSVTEPLCSSVLSPLMDRCLSERTQPRIGAALTFTPRL